MTNQKDHPKQTQQGKQNESQNHSSFFGSGSFFSPAIQKKEVNNKQKKNSKENSQNQYPLVPYQFRKSSSKEAVGLKKGGKGQNVGGNQYYNQKGKKIIEDDTGGNGCYVLWDDNEAKTIKNAVKEKEPVDCSKIVSKIKLPSPAVRKEIKKMEQMNKKNDLREYGGEYGKLKDGSDKVVWAKPSEELGASEGVHIDPENVADESERGILEEVGGSFHSHPSGVFGGGDYNAPPAKSAQQIPSGDLHEKKGGDIGYSVEHAGVHIMLPLGKRDKVYLLENGMQASLPYKVFFKIGY